MADHYSRDQLGSLFQGILDLDSPEFSWDLDKGDLGGVHRGPVSPPISPPWWVPPNERQPSEANPRVPYTPSPKPGVPRYELPPGVEPPSEGGFLPPIGVEPGRPAPYPPPNPGVPFLRPPPVDSEVPLFHTLPILPQLPPGTRFAPPGLPGVFEPAAPGPGWSLQEMNGDLDLFNPFNPSEPQESDQRWDPQIHPQIPLGLPASGLPPTGEFTRSPPRPIGRWPSPGESVYPRGDLPGIIPDLEPKALVEAFDLIKSLSGDLPGSPGPVPSVMDFNPRGVVPSTAAQAAPKATSRGTATLDSVFPPGVLGGLQSLFQSLLTNPGIPEDVMNRVQGFNRAEILAQERRRIQRRSSEFSGRGMFGSGQHFRDVRGIEADAETGIGRSATALSLENVRQAEAGRRLASSLGLGMGGAGLDVSRLNLAEILGLGDLDVRRLGLEIDKADREARLNFLIQSSLFGEEPDSVDDSGPGDDFFEDDLANINYPFGEDVFRGRGIRGVEGSDSRSGDRTVRDMWGFGT